MQDNNSPLNLDQLQYIQDLLKDASENKLSGRQVMIPVTSKAFFEGHLDPAMQTDSSGEKEQVIVKVGGEYLAEMSLEDASRYIERRMKDLRPQVAAMNNSEENQKPKSALRLKKGFLNEKPKIKMEQYKQEKQKLNESKIATISYDEPILPFMEILEEYDSSGKQVKAEALDVSQQLMDFRRKINKIRMEEGKDMNASDASPSYNKGAVLDTIMNSIPDDIETDSDQHDRTYRDVYPTRELKRDELEDISARLDQLALLEEEEEKKKHNNMKSSKSIQGKGWNKGFLSNSANRTKPTNNVVRSEVKNKDNSYDILRNDTNVSLDVDHEKKVQFSNNTQVKEIPRIGNRSIQNVMGFQRQSEIATNIISTQNLKQSIMESTRLSPLPAVSDQGRLCNPVAINGVMERQNGTSSTPSSEESNKTTENEPKKLSRFAQRRQQMR